MKIGLGILRSIQLSYGGKVKETSGMIAGFIAELSLNNKMGIIRICKINGRKNLFFRQQIIPFSFLLLQ